MILISDSNHNLCLKSVRIRRFSGPHFLTFGLNTETYRVSLCIQSECGKMRTEKTPNTNFFTQCIGKVFIMFF